MALGATGSAGVALLACGGSHPAAHAAADDRAAEQTAETKFDDFARCLREHGINAESLSRPGGGDGLKVMGGDAAAMQTAEKACARYRPRKQTGASRFSPQQKVELDERLQRFAKCMRRHGVQIEASVAGDQPHINVQATPDGPGPRPESPAFQAAQKACSKLLPDGGPEGTGEKGPSQ